MRVCFVAGFAPILSVAMAVTNRDLFEIACGRCKDSFCDCESYSILSSTNIRCEYCDHSSGPHERTDELGKCSCIVLVCLCSVYN